MAEEKTIIEILSELIESINNVEKQLKESNKIMDKIANKLLKDYPVKIEVKTSTVEEIKEALKPFILATMR